MEVPHACSAYADCGHTSRQTAPVEAASAPCLPDAANSGGEWLSVQAPGKRLRFSGFLFVWMRNTRKRVPLGLVPKNSEEAMTVAVKEKLRIRLKGYDHTLVDTAAAKIVETAKRTGARVAGPIPLPTDKEIVTILRAVHKYKDSREQFEMRTHKRLIDVLRPSAKTVEALQGLELPAGVEIEINL